MSNIINDDVDSVSDDINIFSNNSNNINNNNSNNNNNNNNNNDDDEKKPMISGHNNYGSKSYTDLRSNPPPSGSALYQNSSGSKFDQIIGNIERVKESVKENIEMAMERHENVALLQGKTDRLHEESALFRNRSRSLHYRYCRDLYKQRCVIVCIIIFVIYLLSAMICGWGWQSCG